MKKNISLEQAKLNNKNHANELLDKTDRKILNILQKDNQITNQSLADKVGISAPPCFRRVKPGLSATVRD